MTVVVGDRTVRLVVDDDDAAGRRYLDAVFEGRYADAARALAADPDDGEYLAAHLTVGDFTRLAELIVKERAHGRHR